jgi:hypothetical protein
MDSGAAWGRQAPIGDAVELASDHLDDSQRIVAGRIRRDRLL